ncbi:MAG: phage portal protein [bacterium]|nr:phage portal protein [bacterium]
MFESRRRRRAIQGLREQIELENLQQADKLLKEASNYAELDPDENSWSLIAQYGRSVRQGMEPLPQSLTEMRKVSRSLALLNSHYKGMLRNYVTYVIGTGIALTPSWKSASADQQKHLWDMFTAKNNWTLRQKEIVYRAFRDGEVFLRFFGEGERMKIRFIEPEYVMDPQDKYPYGIETDPEDAEKVEAYHYSLDGQSVERIPADDVQHIKLSVDSSAKRGVPYLLAEITTVKDVDTFIRHLLQYIKVSTAVVLVRKYSGMSPTAVKEHVAGMQHGTRYDSKKGKDVPYQYIEPGTFFDISDKQSLEWQSPQLDARPLLEGYRLLMLKLSAGSNQTEPMVSGDASNANYSSSMVAEAPPIKSFEDWQQFFGGHFVNIFRRVVRLSETDEDQPGFKAARNVSRDRLSDAKADEVLAVHGVMSTQTWRGREGLDPDVEKENLQNEVAEMLGPKRKSVTAEDKYPPEEHEA